MSFFNKILSAIGLGKKAEAAENKPAAQPAQTATATATAPAAPAQAAAAPSAPAAPAVKAIAEVDVVSQLEAKSKAAGGKLNWKNSIVDLLKLLDLDSSLAARKELAQELNCPADKIGGDYSQMNIWLHKAVIQKIAENGGNIPKEML